MNKIELDEDSLDVLLYYWPPEGARTKSYLVLYTCRPDLTLIQLFSELNCFQDSTIVSSINLMRIVQFFMALTSVITNDPLTKMDLGLFRGTLRQERFGGFFQGTYFSFCSINIHSLGSVPCRFRLSGGRCMKTDIVCLHSENDLIKFTEIREFWKSSTIAVSCSPMFANKNSGKLITVCLTRLNCIISSKLCRPCSFSVWMCEQLQPHRRHFMYLYLPVYSSKQ